MKMKHEIDTDAAAAGAAAGAAAAASAAASAEQHLCQFYFNFDLLCFKSIFKNSSFLLGQVSARFLQ